MRDTNNSRLDNTYFNNSASRLNFYKTYRNDRNTLEDPIITGFTLDIDTLHSPLFYV